MTQVLAVSAKTAATATPEFLSQGKLATKLLGVCRLKEEQCQEVCMCHSHSSRTQLLPEDRFTFLTGRTRENDRKWEPD